MARLLGSATMANDDSTIDIYPSIYILVKSYSKNQVSTVVPRGVPTLGDFESRFISERLKLHIRPSLGRLRLDEIDKQSEQRLKAAMKQFDQVRWRPHRDSKFTRHFHRTRR